MGSCGMRLLAWVLFLVCFSSGNARPKNSNAVQKELYTRQILPAIPGYIPVYIQHGEEPLGWKSTPVKQRLKIKTQVQEKKPGETTVKRKKAPNAVRPDAGKISGKQKRERKGRSSRRNRN